MVDDNRARMDILFKALSEARIIYSKANYPNLKKDDYETLGNLYRQIVGSVEIAIDLEYPNVNIEHIPPKIVFTTFLNQEHGMDLSPEEVDTILKNR